MQLEIPGVRALHREGKRIRALIDLDRNGLENLAAAGALDLTHSIVDLEELFISLLKK